MNWSDFEYFWEVSLLWRGMAVLLGASFVFFLYQLASYAVYVNCRAPAVSRREDLQWARMVRKHKHRARERAMARS